MIHNSLKLVGQENQNLEKLPGHYIIKGNRAVGITLIVFSIIFGAESIYHVINTIFENSQNIQKLEIKHIVFAQVGVIFLLWGINQFVINGKLLVEKDKVTCNYKNLLGRHSWSENISSYRGVSKKIEKGQSNSVGSRQLYYAIWLVNRKRNRSIKLYRAWSNKEWEQQLQRYSELFNLPVLE